jgi:hypothetical protein
MLPGGGNTSGMARHLKRAHPAEYSEFKDSSRLVVEAETKVEPKPAKTKPEKREDPSPRDVWKFYDNVTSSSGLPDEADEENISDDFSAVCKFCQAVVKFTSEDMQPLEDHLNAEHQVNFFFDIFKKLQLHNIKVLIVFISF